MNAKTSPDMFDIVVVGASAAGMRAACRARRLLPEASILVVDAAEKISVGACGLPYVLSGDIDSTDELIRTSYGVLRTREYFAEFKGVRVECGIEAVGLDQDRKILTLKDLDSDREMGVSFHKLVIATGARPLNPFGISFESKRIRPLKSPDDVDALKAGLESGGINTAVVVGGGFIGCEAAEALTAMWGAEVRLLEAMPQVLPGVLDPEMAALVQSHLVEQEVELKLGRPVGSVREYNDKVEIELDGDKLNVDAAICALGVVPNVEFASRAGLETGPKGALVVDEHLRTSNPDIFAAGDCIVLPHCVSGELVYLPLGSLANRHGRAIGDNLAGRPRSVPPVSGACAIKVFDLTVARTGLTQGDAKRLGLDHACVWGTFDDKAHYYPGAREVHFKLVYEKGTKRLLGLQAVGQGAGVKEVDVFSALLAGPCKVGALLDIDSAYAPPYSGAMNALHFLGAAALNAEEDGIEPVSPVERLQAEIIVDVREESETSARPVEDPQGKVVHIPLGKLRDRLHELERKDVLFVCARGTRSYEAVRIAKARGIDKARYLGGGLSLRRKGLAWFSGTAKGLVEVQ